jgi:pimeloyl-ACP methyl ester carboxylesterase
MKNWHKGVFFIFLSVFVMAWGVVGRAEEDDESNQAEPEVGYEESTPITPKAEEAIKEATLLPEALDVVPVQSAVPETPKAAAAVSPGPSAAVKTAAQPVLMPEAIPAGEIIPGAGPASSATVPSGLLEVDGYKYPVYLFVPKDYKLDRTYAMIMIAPAEFAKAEQQIEYLTGLAQRKSLFILAPYVLWPKSGTTPYTLDEWLLSVKKDILERFPINKKRVYLVGKGSGAQYAGYLAVKYPQEFSAVALLGEAWDGPFSQLVDPQSDAVDQVPFYVALKADGDAKARNQAWFDKLQQKGYPIHLVDYQTDAELDQLDFKKSVFDWLEATSQSWAVSAANSQTGWKGKFKKGVKDFFVV